MATLPGMTKAPGSIYTAPTPTKKATTPTPKNTVPGTTYFPQPSLPSAENRPEMPGGRIPGVVTHPQSTSTTTTTQQQTPTTTTQTQTPTTTTTGGGSTEQASTTQAPTTQTPTLAGETTADQMVAAQWAAIEDSMKAMLPDQLRDVDRQTALNARRANEMNALMGGNISGAWGSGQAQAQLGGMAMRQNAVVENQKTQMNLRMSYLQSLMDRAAQQERLASSEAEAQAARNLQRELQTMIDSTAIIIAQLNAGAVPGANTSTSTSSSAGGGSSSENTTQPQKKQPGLAE